MDITAAANAQSTASAGERQSAAGTATLADFDVFLNLFVSQLKNQDPLSPMNTEEFLAQTAQFSSVEQLVSLNKQVSALAEQNDAGRWTNTASLIGREVYARSEDAEGVVQEASGRVVEIGYGPSGDLLLGLEGGEVIPLTSVVTVSET